MSKIALIIIAVFGIVYMYNAGYYNGYREGLNHRFENLEGVIYPQVNDTIKLENIELHKLNWR
jgi:hypothetical protein